MWTHTWTTKQHDKQSHAHTHTTPWNGKKIQGTNCSPLGGLWPLCLIVHTFVQNHCQLKSVQWSKLASAGAAESSAPFTRKRMWQEALLTYSLAELAFRDNGTCSSEMCSCTKHGKQPRSGSREAADHVLYYYRPIAPLLLGCQQTREWWRFSLI